MFKRLAAVVLLVGLVLPHSCGVSPLFGAWQGVATAIMFGIPVLVTIAYVLHHLAPALARFHERHGAALHGFFRAVCFILLGVYVGAALDEDSELRARIATGVSLVVTLALLLWVVGVGAIWAFVAYVGDGMQAGGWVFTVGWLLAVGAEVNGLRGAALVEHGGYGGAPLAPNLTRL